MEAWLLGLVAVFLCGAVGASLLSPYGRGGIGFALGFFCGPVGVLIAAVLRPVCLAALAQTSAFATRACPDCAETILAAARKCRYCGAELQPLSPEALEASRVSDLVARLGSGRPQLREDAIIALCGLGERGLPALSVIEKLRQDSNRSVRTRAAWAVEEFARLAPN
jgi:hypothetical protein